MALSASNVRVAVTGAVYVAPTGTTLPTTAAAALGAGFIDLGYVSEDGVTEAYEDETTEIKGWQGGATVRTVFTGSTATLSFTLIETKADVLELFHKNSSIVTDGSSGWKMNVVTPGIDKRVFVLDVIDGTNEVRIVVPSGEVTERGEIVYKNDEPVGYQVTLTCYPTTQGTDANTVLVKLSGDTAWSGS